ncbi:MAG: sensor histidine kinase [Candidatus Nanogingivalis sp.]
MNSKEQKLFKFGGDIFKSAHFSLSMLYFLILLAIIGIFNIVIFYSINTNTMEISTPPIETSFSKDKNSYGTDELREKIITARNKRASEQITESILILDFLILLAGGIGSFWLAHRALEPLEKAHKLQSEFVSNASHEIRTPLAAIQLETEIILKDKTASKDELREVLESNLEEAKSLTAMVKMLLSLSKINEEIQLSAVNLNEIIKARISKFPDAEKKIKFEDGKEFIVQNNETAIDEIAMILIDNALKYNISKEPIEVKIFRQNRQAVLSVSNFSNEISQDELNKYFDRFYRCDKVRSCNNHTEGYGLGLAIAKKLAEETHSVILAKNERIPKTKKFKTTFSVLMRFSR